MSKFKEAIKSPHILISLATGFSIIVMAYVSKRVLTEPIGYLALAIPPFLAAIYELILNRFKGKRICTIWYWVVAILLATALVIVFHMI